MLALDGRMNGTARRHRRTLVAMLAACRRLSPGGAGASSRDVEIGLHGWIALGLGVAVTTLLGVGLMWLVYYSNRRGYDDEAGRD